MRTPHTILLSRFLGGDEENIKAFKEAGDEIVDFVIAGKKYSWYEAFLRPIGFLYRHYLELELKYWIKELNERTAGEAEQVLKCHNLSNLWLKLRPLLQPFCMGQENQEILHEVEEVILTFNMYDPSGQEFRYTRTTEDTSTLKNLPESIDVKAVKSLIERVSFFFDGLGGVVSI